MARCLSVPLLQLRDFMRELQYGIAIANATNAKLVEDCMKLYQGPIILS